MSTGTLVAIGIVCVVSAGYIGWLVGYHMALRDTREIHDNNNILREALADAHRQAEEQFVARYEAGVTDALEAVRRRRSEAGIKAGITRAMRQQVGAMVAETVESVEAA